MKFEKSSEDLTKKLNWNNGSHNIFGNLGSEAKYKKLKNLLCIKIFS